MKKLLLFLVASFALQALDESFIANRIDALQTIAQEAETVVWRGQQPLTNEQLQIFLNFTCVSYALVYSAYKMRAELKFIGHMSNKIRANFLECVDHPEYISMLERSLVRFKELLKSQQMLQKDYEELDKRIRIPENMNLFAVASSLAHHATHLMYQTADREKETTKKTIADSIGYGDKARTRIHVLTNTLQALYDDNYPFNSVAENMEIEKIEVLRRIAEMSAEQMESLENLMSSLNASLDVFEEFCALVFYTYYKVTFDGMKKRNVSEQFFVALFEDNAVVAADKKTRTITEPIVDTTKPFFA